MEIKSIHEGCGGSSSRFNCHTSPFTTNTPPPYFHWMIPVEISNEILMDLRVATIKEHKTVAVTFYYVQDTVGNHSPPLSSSTVQGRNIDVLVLIMLILLGIHEDI